MDNGLAGEVDLVYDMASIQACTLVRHRKKNGYYVLNIIENKSRKIYFERIK